jgi:hypothetical protein
MTASMTPSNEQESSSIEPGWGRIESSKEKERMEDLRLWKSINIGGYTNQRTTKVYRHGRCYMCSKPVSAVDLDPEMELFCKKCDQELTKLDCGYDRKKTDEQTGTTTNRGLEKEERDDEEEWGRIPIPQSDDTDSTDEWLSEEPNEYESTSTDDQDQNKKGYLNCFMAFLIAPRKDGRVLTKDGQIIDVDDCSTTTGKQFTVTLPENLPARVQLITRPYWTHHLFAYQHQQLRKGYRKKDRSKVMMKLIRQIQRYHQNKLKNSSGTTTLGRQPIFHTLLPQQFDTELGFINRPNTLRQCMNAVSPCQASKHKLSPVKTSNTDSYAKKSRNTFSPIVIPRTPEATIPDLQEEKSSDTRAEQEWAYIMMTIPGNLRTLIYTTTKFST